MGDVTEDQALQDFKKFHSVTEDQATSDYLKAAHQGQSYSGDLADQTFSQGGLGRVMNAFGEGARQAWGSHIDLEGDLKNWVHKTKILNDFAQHHQNFAKSFNEALIRPWGKVNSALANTFMMGLGGLTHATGELGRVLEDESKHPFPGYGAVVAPIEGALGEILQHVEPHPMDTSDPTNQAVAGFIHTDLPGFALKSRAHGIIGEGESGYFNTKPVTEDNLYARTDAAKESGISVPRPPAPQTDPNYVARLISPDLFKEYDRLRDLQENLRLSLQNERAKRDVLRQEGMAEGHPEMKKNLSGISDLQKNIQATDEKLRDLIPSISEARERGQDYLSSDSPEGAAFRDFVNKGYTPDIQKEVQSLKERQDHYRKSIDYWTKKSGPDSEEVLNSKTAIDNLEGQIRDLLSRPDHPESQAFTNELQAHLFENEMRLAETAEEIQTTQAHAKSLMPDPNNTKKTAEDKAKVKVSESSTPQERLVAARDEQATKLGYKSHEDVIKQLDKAKAEAKTEGTTEQKNAVKILEDAVNHIENNEYVKTSRDIAEGPKRTSGLAKDIESRTIEKEIGDRFGDLPEYETVNIKSESEAVSKMIAEDYNRAKRIAYGREEAPAGTNTMSYLVGVEKKAMLEGDYETLRRLANSALTVEASKAAQKLRILAERDPDSPVSVLSALDEVRKKQAETKIKREMTRLLDELDAVKSYDESTLSKFIKSIECDY